MGLWSVYHHFRGQLEALVQCSHALLWRCRGDSMQRQSLELHQSWHARMHMPERGSTPVTLSRTQS